MRTHKLDESTTLILTDNIDQSIKIAEDLTNDPGILEDVIDYTIENEEDDIILISFVDKSGDVIKIAITEADRLREMLKRKHPEMDDEEIDMRLQLYKDEFGADFERSDVDYADEDEEGLISEEEEESLIQQMEEVEESEEQEGLMSFSDELKYMFENQGDLSIVYIPSGKRFDVKKVRDDGLAVYDPKIDKLVLLKNEVLDEKADQFQIM